MSQQQQARPSDLKAWVRSYFSVALLGLTTIVAYGVALYAYGVLLPGIAEETGWAIGTLSGSFALSTLLTGFLAILAGRTLDRYGLFPVVITSTVLGSLTLLGASSVNHPVAFVLLWGVGAAIVAGGLYYHITTAASVRLHLSNRATALSVLTLIGALSSPIFSPLTGFLVDEVGWRWALRWLIVLMIVFSLPSAFIKGAASQGEVARRAGFRDSLRLLKYPVVWRTFLAFALGASAMGSLVLHQVPAMTAAGIGLAAASGYAGARGLFQFPGRLALPLLIGRFGLVGSTIISFAGVALGTLMLWSVGWLSVPTIMAGAFAVTAGVALGLRTPLQSLYSAEVFGTERLGTLSGFMQLVIAVTSASAEWLSGVAVDLTGNYTLTLMAIMVVQLMAIPVLLWQRKAPPLEVG